MRAEGQRVCKVCGTLLPETSDSCPVCVLQGALKPEDDSRPSSVDPNVSELCFEYYQVLRKEDGTPMEFGGGRWVPPIKRSTLIFDLRSR
jgi:hypothetical protein